MIVVVRTVGWQRGNNVDDARCQFPSGALFFFVSFFSRDHLELPLVPLQDSDTLN